MGHMVTYSDNEGIATIRIDDGKANAVSFQFLEEMNTALDQAERESAVIVLTGRPGKFSAGFDLSVVTKGGKAALGLVRGGARLTVRLLGFPTPVITACNGHCLALGALLLLSTDYRIGVEGEYKIGLNEVAIGMPLPYFGVEIAARDWLPPTWPGPLSMPRSTAPEMLLRLGFWTSSCRRKD